MSSSGAFFAGSATWALLLLVLHYRRGRGEITRLLRRVLRHWLPFGLFALLCLVVAGGALGAFGVPSLFRDDPALRAHGWGTLLVSPEIWGHFSAVLVLAGVWSVVLQSERLVGPEDHGPGPAAHLAFLVREAVPFSGFLLLAAVCPVHPDLAAGATERLGCGARALVGAFGGWAFTALMVRAAYRIPERLLASFADRRSGRLRAGLRVAFAHGVEQAGLEGPEAERRYRAYTTYLGYVVVILVPLGFGTGLPFIVPAASFCLLLGWVVVGYFLVLTLRPIPRALVLGSATLWVTLANADPYKATFPGLPGDPAGPPVERVDPVEALEAWRQRIAPGGRPPIILVSASGGAYRAGLWTAHVLDALAALDGEPGTRGLSDHIRVVTGASGGMVAGAYFAVLRGLGRDDSVERALLADIQAANTANGPSAAHRFGHRYPVPGDSLSVAVQQMVQRDLFALARPGPRAYDRGRALEDQWGTLGVSFHALAAAEREGRAPSVILSPMIADSGQPLLISNLDLSAMIGEAQGVPAQAASPETVEDPREPGRSDAVELFDMFPRARSFRVATAVRMNASFPYISPAVSLPGPPRRRVVDAGYYDNFGISTAVAWTSQPEVRAWLEAHSGGIIFVEIRDEAPNPGGAPAEATGVLDRARRAFSWFTTPFEAVGAARSASMVFRNEQDVRQIAVSLPSLCVRKVVFTNTAEAGLSWFVPTREQARIAAGVNSTGFRGSLDQLRAAWAACGGAR